MSDPFSHFLHIMWSIINSTGDSLLWPTLLLNCSQYVSIVSSQNCNFKQPHTEHHPLFLMTNACCAFLVNWGARQDTHKHRRSTLWTVITHLIVIKINKDLRGTSLSAASASWCYAPVTSCAPPSLLYLLLLFFPSLFPEPLLHCMLFPKQFQHLCHAGSYLLLTLLMLLPLSWSQFFLPAPILHLSFVVIH